MIETITAPDPVELARKCPELNDLEIFMRANGGVTEWPVVHRFTPGLYSRIVHLSNGDAVISKIHKTEHQFVISKGVLAIWSPDKFWQVVQSPYHGITKRGDRRAVLAFSDVTWVTFHATDKTDIAEIERDLFE
jgi:hypothetical protein